jgi:hypothetical protein
MTKAWPGTASGFSESQAASTGPVSLSSRLNAAVAQCGAAALVLPGASAPPASAAIAGHPAIPARAAEAKNTSFGDFCQFSGHEEAPTPPRATWVQLVSRWP